MYFCTKSGSLLELSGTGPPRWKNHGRPTGTNVAVIATATSFGPHVVFIISGTGDLYEFDSGSKPSWKKHIHKEGSIEDVSLSPSKGCCISGLKGASSVSLFLLTKVSFSCCFMLLFLFEVRFTFMLCCENFLSVEKGWTLDRATISAKELEMDSSWKSNRSFTDFNHMCLSLSTEWRLAYTLSCFSIWFSFRVPDTQ